jgi:hypothetical protein
VELQTLLTRALERPVVSYRFARPGRYVTRSGSQYQIEAAGDRCTIQRVGGNESWYAPGACEVLTGVPLLATLEDDEDRLVFIDPESGSWLLRTTRISVEQ